MRVSAAVLIAAVLAHSGVHAEQTFNRVNLTEAAANGGVCLDGTTPVYYLWKGDPERWIVFFEGGGWCYDDVLCAERAKTYVVQRSAYLQRTVMLRFDLLSHTMLCTAGDM
jgi:hypothetical protein